MQMYPVSCITCLRGIMYPVSCDQLKCHSRNLWFVIRCTICIGRGNFIYLRTSAVSSEQQDKSGYIDWTNVRSN